METNMADLCIPKDDGVTHVNIYSKSKSELGLLLSNFTYFPFDHPNFGHFDSMEGFWYWLATGKKHNELRAVYGVKAKKLGKTFPRIDNPDFQSEFISGLEIKAGNAKIKKLLAETYIPIVHYYYFGDVDNCRVVIPTGSDWFTEWWERKRLALNGDWTCYYF